MTAPATEVAGIYGFSTNAMPSQGDCSMLIDWPASNTFTKSFLSSSRKACRHLGLSKYDVDVLGLTHEDLLKVAYGLKDK